MVEFALVAPLAMLVAMAVAQFALFLYERNVVMGSLSEGARVAATSGRTAADGQRAAAKLLREALGGRVAAIVSVRGAIESGLVVVRADATLPSFVPGLPGLEVHMTAVMHKEEDLGGEGETRAAGPAAAVPTATGPMDAGPAGGEPAAVGPAAAKPAAAGPMAVGPTDAGPAGAGPAGGEQAGAVGVGG